jgi:branched-chain amino acid aminotransferase
MCGRDGFFRLDDHLERFLASAAKLRFELPMSKPEIARMLHRLVALSGLEKPMSTSRQAAGRCQRAAAARSAAATASMPFAVPFSWIARPEEHDHGISMVVAARSASR